MKKRRDLFDAFKVLSGIEKRLSKKHGIESVLKPTVSREIKLEFIAEAYKDTDLSVIALYMQLEGRDLRGNDNTAQKPQVALEDLAKGLEEWYGIQDIRTKRRFASIIEVKRKFIWRAYTEGYTQKEIAKYLGYKEHSTVARHIKTYHEKNLRDK